MTGLSLSAGSAFQKLVYLLLDDPEGLQSHYLVQVRMGVVEAINVNTWTVPTRGWGYENRGFLRLKVQRMAATKTEFAAFRKAAYIGPPVRYSLSAKYL